MLSVSNIQVNYGPAATGVRGPISISWAIQADGRDVTQEAYQIQITRRGDTAPLLDTGLVKSRQSAHISVEAHWDSAARYMLQVRVQVRGQRSDWGETSFTTALQTQEAWKGQFITVETEADRDQNFSTLLRKEFPVSKPLREAFLVSTAHGIYHATLNGQPVSQDELCPGWTAYNKRLLYQVWEVTDLLQEGENAIGVALGAGWYKGTIGYKLNRNLYGPCTAFGGQLILRYADGTEEWVCADASWKGSRGPVLFSEIYNGEVYDARLEQPGWDRPGFDDAAWQPVNIVERDNATLFPQEHPAVREQERIPAVRLFTTPAGERVVDFGQNLAGWCEVTLEHTRPGDVLELQCFETLDADGNVYTENLRAARQTVRYICKGADREVCRPWFTYQGFQYVKIASCPGEVKPEHFVACVVHSDLAPTGTFSCSNPLLNQLWHNITWGMKGNFVDVPTDCPQRDERLGWTGDINVFSRTACYLRNGDAFLRKWLRDLAADQNARGAVPHVSPDVLTGHMDNDFLLDNGFQGGAVGWGDAAVCVPWVLYLTYGDKTVLAQQMDSILAWVRFLEEHSGDLDTFGFQFGDWLALDAAPGDYKGATPDGFVIAAWYSRSVRLAARMLAVLERREEAAEMARKADALEQDFQRRFFGADGAITVRTQTAHVLALAFGLVPEAYRAKTVEGLKTLLAEAGGHLTTGFMGTPFLAQVLSDNGCLEEAWDLVLKEDFPSWLYQVKQGATTIWEHWDGKRPDGTMWSADMNSFNHYAYGSIGEWLVRTAAGLEIDEDRPGYKHFYIQPKIGGNLTHAEVSYCSGYGEIRIRWTRTDDMVTLEAQIPANTTAAFRLNQASEILDPDGLTFRGTQAEAGSGCYTVRYRLA